MKSKTFLLLHGVILWLIPFVAAMQLYPLRDINHPLFVSVMTIILTLSTVVVSLLYFRHTQKNSLKDGIFAGIFWFLLNIFLDALLFPFVPIRMTIFEFFSEIGTTYLMIPIITTGITYTIRKEEKRLRGYVF